MIQQYRNNYMYKKQQQWDMTEEEEVFSRDEPFHREMSRREHK